MSIRSWYKLTLLILLMIILTLCSYGQIHFVLASEEDTVVLTSDFVYFSPYKKRNTFELSWINQRGDERAYGFMYGRRKFFVDVTTGTATHYRRKKLIRRYRKIK